MRNYLLIMATTPELNNGQPCSSLENALEEDKTFVENIKKVLLSNLEVMNNGGLADDECRKAIIKNKVRSFFRSVRVDCVEDK